MHDIVRYQFSVVYYASLHMLTLMNEECASIVYSSVLKVASVVASFSCSSSSN